MKLAPSYYSRESLLKKVAKRNNKRMQEYTTVSTAMKPEVAKVYGESRDSVARYAQKHNCNIEFAPNSDNLNTTKMNVFKRQLCYHDLCDGSEPISYMVKEPIGSAVIPNTISATKDMINTIKTEAAKIIYQ